MTRTQHTYIDIRFANSKRITRWLGWNILFLCVCVVSISIHINLAVYIARPLFPISYMNEYFGMEALFKKNTRYIYIYIIHIRSQKRFLKTKLEIARVPYVPCAPPTLTHTFIFYLLWCSWHLSVSLMGSYLMILCVYVHVLSMAPLSTFSMCSRNQLHSELHMRHTVYE